MTFSFAPANSQSSYLPVEFDLTEDEQINKELLEKRQRLLATIVNVKENANYQKSEILSAQQWFNQAQAGALQTSYGYRYSFDLVEFNGGPIGAGATILTLLATPTPTVPGKINIPTALKPTHGFGGCTNATNFYFINDPLVFVRTNIWSNASQTITITNNTGSDLTQCFWVFEYIKI